MNRRRFVLLACGWFLGIFPATAAERPNILWITAEDMSPNLGCYGDTFARTPHLDALAGQSVRFTSAFATAPVCSPSRVALATGVYATSAGSPHLRCQISLPDDFRGLAGCLRQASYFTCNNFKTDYNLRDEQAFIEANWDRCDEQAHWRQRRAGQPFFAVFNLMETHQSRTSVWPWEEFESQIGSRLKPNERADPDKVPLPPFYPDTSLARRSMARYYDCIQAMDREVGRILEELQADGLAEDTIVFFYSDHGMGMPRGKRCLYDSGLRVPLLVRFPPRWQKQAPVKAGESLDRLVSFIDFPPTVLSLAGVEIPRQMQGSAFLGSEARTPREFVFAARDRVDEAYDTSRSVRDQRWLYIRNYRSHLPWAQPEGYSDQSDFRRELLSLADRDDLSPGLAGYLAPYRPVEELYETQADPHQLHNLAGLSEHRAVLDRMRAALREWMLSTRDLGFLPEADLAMRCGNDAPYTMARQEGKYPMESILAAAVMSGRQPDMRERLKGLVSKDPDSVVRFWAAESLWGIARDAKHGRGKPFTGPVQSVLLKSLKDESSAVRIAAAATLVEMAERPAKPAMEMLIAELNSPDWNASLQAARTLQLLGPAASNTRPAMEARLADVRQHEGKEVLALFVRFALEGALDSSRNEQAK